MQICQIVGYKNSGKTTLMNKLIYHFSAMDTKVGSLKHHGHGGEPSMLENTDSYQHMEYGSMISGVQGENISQFIFHMKLELHELIQIYRNFPIELLLVEGYKKADHPKVVLLRNKEDLSLLDELSNIIAVVLWDEVFLNENDYPAFNLHNINANLAQLADCIRRC